MWPRADNRDFSSSVTHGAGGPGTLILGLLTPEPPSSLCREHVSKLCVHHTRGVLVMTSPAYAQRVLPSLRMARSSLNRQQEQPPVPYMPPPHPTPSTFWGILFMHRDLADLPADKIQSKCWNLIPPEMFPEGRGLASLGHHHSRGSCHLLSTYYVLDT